MFNVTITGRKIKSGSKKVLVLSLKIYYLGHVSLFGNFFRFMAQFRIFGNFFTCLKYDLSIEIRDFKLPKNLNSLPKVKQLQRVLN